MMLISADVRWCSMVTKPQSLQAEFCAEDFCARAVPASLFLISVMKPILIVDCLHSHFKCLKYDAAHARH